MDIMEELDLLIPHQEGEIGAMTHPSETTEKGLAMRVTYL